MSSKKEQESRDRRFLMEASVNFFKMHKVSGTDYQSFDTRLREYVRNSEQYKRLEGWSRTYIDGYVQAVLDMY